MNRRLRRKTKSKQEPPRTAFDWRAYLNRCDALRVLRVSRVLVDTLISTEDGYSDSVHWQVITALCPELVAASTTVETDKSRLGTVIWRHLRLPDRVDGLMARKFLECAYGQPIKLDKSCLNEFYSLALYYNITHAIKICLNYSCRLVDIHNCIQLLPIAVRHEHQKLRRAAYNRIRSNFKLILHLNEDFHQLSPDYMKRLLMDDHSKLNEDEEFAWLAIVRWANQAPMSSRELIELYYRMVAVEPRQQQSSPQQEVTQQPGARLAGSRLEQQQVITLRGAATKALMTRYRGGAQIGEWRSFGYDSLRQQQVDGSLLNFYTQSMPLDLSKEQKSSKNSSWSPLKLEVEAKQQSDTLEKVSEQTLAEMIKCLRFMRFRSLNAFNVILEHKLVLNSKRLVQLVNHMRLIYMIRKGLPLDAKQLELVGLVGSRLKKVKYGADGSRLHRRALRYLRRLVDSRQPTVGLNAAAAAYGDSFTMRPPEPLTLTATATEPTKAKQEVAFATSDTKERTSEMIEWRELKELSSDCLNWANKPRVPQSIALLIGGWHEGSVSKSLIAYDFVSDDWFKLRIGLPEPRAFHASCTAPMSNQIYIFGGTNGESILNSVIRFDPSSDICLRRPKQRLQAEATGSERVKQQPETDDKFGRPQLSYKFHNLAPMNERRCHLSGVWHSDGRLYALGGHNGTQRLRSGERYDRNSRRWRPIAEMTIARSDASACSHDNKIFIAGGQISDQFIQSSVEFYKPNDDTWTFAAPMIVPRMSFRLVSYKSHLLAIGGTNGLMGGDEIGSVTRSVEIYNGNLSSWSLCSPMRQKRSSFGVMCIEDNLIVAGGFGGSRRLKSCEALRIGHFRRPPPRAPDASADGARAELPPEQSSNQANTTRQTRAPQIGLRRRVSLSPIRTAMKWVQKANLPAKRSGFTVAVVGPLPNSKEFTYHGFERLKKEGYCSGVLKRRRKFKIIKRRKLIKHLKIALVIAVVILIM